ncbi:MAG: HD domain-containing protein [Anaerolineales bacterium]
MSGLGKRFEGALAYAARLHRQQTRKGSQTPYIAHLLAVTALVLEAGGGEDEAIAALLHDAVEDQGGYQRLEDIRTRFGGRVADIVAACSDAFVTPKPPWRERKEAYLAHLKDAPPEVRRVSLADKLHNARSLLRDYRRQGEVTFERFNGGRDGTLWYYRALAEIFQATDDDDLSRELVRVVEKLEALAAR